MRCLLKVAIPVVTGNATISDGSLSKTIESILADLKPEVAYFAGDNGKRTGFIFFDLKDASQIPAVAEPWFLAFDAHVELLPAMNLERRARQPCSAGWCCRSDRWPEGIPGGPSKPRISGAMDSFTCGRSGNSPFWPLRLNAHFSSGRDG